MKKVVFAACLLTGCTNTQTKTNVAEQIEAERRANNRVAAVIQQLQEDCDSNLMRVARYEVDSIRQARKQRLRVK